LWDSNGAAAGTRMITAINAKGGGLSPYDLTAMGSSVYFGANDGLHGAQLWTSSGTAIVDEINGTAGSNPMNLAVADGLLLFTAYTTNNSYQVWQSNGTAAGTVRDANLNTGGSNIPTNFVVMGTALVFTAPGATFWKLTV
jgi:ELWxxDGT repeat protein